MFISAPWIRTLLTVTLLSLAMSPAWAADRRLLPADTEIVVTLNVKQALDFRPSDPLRDALRVAGGAFVRQATVNDYKKAVSQRLPGFAQIMKVLDRMGFDPFTDLHTLTVAHPGSSELSKLFVVVEGQFAADKLEAALKATGKELGQDLRVVKFGKAWLGEIKLQNADKRVQSVCFALTDGKTLVMSYQAQAVKDAFTRVEENRFVAKKVEDLLKTTNNKQTLSFLLTRRAAAALAQQDKTSIDFLPLPSAIAKDKRMAEFLAALRNAWVHWAPEIDGVSLALTLAQDFKFEFHFGTKDERTAKHWQDLGDFVVFILNDAADWHARQNPELAFLPEITRAMRVTQTGRFADFTGTISYVNLAKLMVWLRPAE